MICGSREPRWLWYLGLTWFQRMRLRLWLHFLPYRIICRIRGRHQWGKPDSSITVGPLHLPPDQRSYHVLGYHRICRLCATRKLLPLTPEKEFELIREAQAEDWEEWNDPETRALLERMR